MRRMFGRFLPLVVVLIFFGGMVTSATPSLAAESGYKLPYPAGVTYPITRAWATGANDHGGTNAVDFAMPEGSTIVAARDGKVVQVVTQYSACGNDSYPNNFLLVGHVPDDGLYEQYTHISSSNVKVEDVVFQGQPIAKSGRVGYTNCGPHLHFQVQKGNPEQQRLYVRFDDVGDIIGGKSYTSGNVDAQLQGYIDNPPPDSTQSGTIRLSGWSNYPNRSTNGIEILIDGVKRGDASLGDRRDDVLGGGNYGWHWDWNTTEYANGTHNIQARVLLENGRSQLLASGKYQDSTKINVQNKADGKIEQPLPDSAQSGVIRISGWAAVAGQQVSRVEIWIDGSNRGEAVYRVARPDSTGNYGWYWDWDTTEYGNGPYTVQVRAVLPSGESSFIASAKYPDSTQIIVQNAVPTASPPMTPCLKPLIRYWRATYQRHFYTSNWNELAGGQDKWKYEKIAGYVADTADCYAPGAVPLYRMNHSGRFTHFYTANEEQRAAAKKEGFVDEGVVGYILPTPNAQYHTAPLHRTRNDDTDDNFYTTNQEELDLALGYNYIDQGITGYLFTDEALAPVTPSPTPSPSQFAIFLPLATR